MSPIGPKGEGGIYKLDKAPKKEKVVKEKSTLNWLKGSQVYFFKSIKDKFSVSAKYKPQRFFDLGPDVLDAVGLPGPAIGHLNMFLVTRIRVKQQHL